MSSTRLLGRGLAVAVLAATGGAPSSASANSIPLFGAPVTLSGAVDSPDFANVPNIATNPRGEETALWQEGRSGQSGAWTASRPEGGAWSTRTQLPFDASLYAEVIGRHALALDAAGTATAAGLADGGVAVVTRSRGVWGTPQSFATPGLFDEAPQLISNAAGDQLLFWKAGMQDGIARQLLVASRRGTGAFSEPQVFPIGYIRAVFGAVNARGDVALAWGNDPDDAGTGEGLRLLTGRVGAPFGTPRIVSPPGEDGDATGAFVTPAGDALITWQQGMNLFWGGDYARWVSAGGVLGPQQFVMNARRQGFGEIQRPVIKVVGYDSGAASVVFAEPFGNEQRIKVADTLPNQPLQSARTLVTVPTSWDTFNGAFADPAGGGLLVAYDTGKQKRLAWRPSMSAGFEASTVLAPSEPPPGGGAFPFQELTFALSGPGRISALATQVSPVTDRLEITARRSALVQGPPGDVTAPTVAIGAVTQVPNAAGGSVVNVGFTLSEAAKVTATLSQLRPGAYVSGVCLLVPGGVPVAPAAACQKRVYEKPSPTAWFNRGARQIRFDTAPKAGTYDLTVEGRDAAANRGFQVRAVTLN